MKSIKQDSYKGTRILLGNEKRNLINQMIEILKANDYLEIQIPIIQLDDIFKDKVGTENDNMMFRFKDRGNRNLCLAPEYTAIIQRLANGTMKQERDLKLFYVQECFRGEKPQAGRYRQFTQLGVEIINPKNSYNALNEVQEIAWGLTTLSGLNCELNKDVSRGLDYYKNGEGFEISCESLGSSKQVCGGGIYDGGVGFAIGIDRLI